MKKVFNVSNIFIFLMISLSSCSGYNNIYHADNYEKSCDQQKPIKLAKGMEISRKDQKISKASSTTNLNNYLMPDLLVKQN